MVRQVLLSTAQQLHATQGAFNTATLASAAQAGRLQTRRAVENMVRCGDLVRVGHEKRADGTGWVGLYEPAAPALPADDGNPCAPLEWAQRMWVRAGTTSET